MNGKTHLGIGAAIGGITALYFSPAEQLNSLALFIGIGGFSGLAADLDGPSLLTRKITKLSGSLHQFTLIAGIIGIVLYSFLWLIKQQPPYLWLGASVACILLGLVVSRSKLRGAMVSLIGGALLIYGLSQGWYWLIGLGIFIIIAPWLKHRGLTHTIWVVPLWGLIGYGIEEQLGVKGLALTAALAYLSHIVADMFTPAGVRLLAPFSKKKFKLKL